MKHAACLVGAAVALALSLPAAAQMHNGYRMGGSPRAMVNLVSPADSSIQIRRGALMIGQYMFGMGQHPLADMPGPGGNATPGIRFVLRLYGVSDATGLLTNTENHFVFHGQVTTPTGSTPIAIDQTFALHGGSALVQVPLSLPAITDAATITIDSVVVSNGGVTFALPGVALGQPTPQMTPQPTPHAGCTSDSDCNDGNPNTDDTCTPMGCVHMPDHMGPGGGPMM